MSCVTIGIIITIWLISFFLTRCTTIGATLGGMPLFCSVVAGTHGYGACWWQCIMGYWCFTCALTWFGTAGNSCFIMKSPLCLLVIFPTSFGMMLKISARLFNAAWCVSFNVTNTAFGTGYCNAWIRYHASSVGSSPENMIFTWITNFLHHIMWPNYTYHN